MKTCLTEKRNAKRKEERIPVYQTPAIITYAKEEIFEELGPAQACSPSLCPVTP
jgi:hypothetical protein